MQCAHTPGRQGLNGCRRLLRLRGLLLLRACWPNAAAAAAAAAVGEAHVLPALLDAQQLCASVGMKSCCAALRAQLRMCIDV